MKEFRKKAKITQTDFASLLDMSRPSISNIEGGKQNATPHNLYLAACILRCKVGDFYPEVIELDLTQFKTETVIVIKRKGFKTVKA